jgi:hypothetical protein
MLARAVNRDGIGGGRSQIGVIKHGLNIEGIRSDRNFSAL